jgi:hypothetical protein
VSSGRRRRLAWNGFRFYQFSASIASDVRFAELIDLQFRPQSINEQFQTYFLLLRLKQIWLLHALI